MATKFTFKTVKESFRRGVYQPEFCMVQLDKKDCGAIRKDEEGNWFIKLMTKQEGTFIWKWIKVTKLFNSVEAAQVWLNENFKILTDKYTFK